jgi:hypothetical protein
MEKDIRLYLTNIEILKVFLYFSKKGYSRKL